MGISRLTLQFASSSVHGSQGYSDKIVRTNAWRNAQIINMEIRLETVLALAFALSSMVSFGLLKLLNISVSPSVKKVLGVMSMGNHIAKQCPPIALKGNMLITAQIYVCLYAQKIKTTLEIRAQGYVLIVVLS